MRSQLQILVFAMVVATTSFLFAADAPKERNQKPRHETEGFLLGADISWVPQQEAAGTRFRDNGVDHDAKRDVLAILKEHGFRWVRLRIFHDPKHEKGYSAEGYCGLAKTLAFAKRIQKADMRLLLDFHYSDNWADPGKQNKPAAWADLHGEQLEKAVRDYSRDVIAALKKQGTPPAMVQIGNEINHGILWPDGRPSRGDYGPLCRLIAAGIAGVKEADPNAKIMLHIALGGQNRPSRAFLDRMLAAGIEFDVIGQSYYPRWHGTLDDLKANLTDLAKRYKQPIIVVEYSTPHLKEVNDIVRGLPNRKGLGTFIWEPTKRGWALFDKQGNAKKELDLFPEISRQRR